jgi:hypothetical protein
MHFGLLDLSLFGVICDGIALVISLEMHFRESVSIITLTYDSPYDGTRMCS